jgi:hypothetical protein
MDLFEIKYKVRPGRHAQEKRQQATLDGSFAIGQSATEIERHAAFRIFVARVLSLLMRYHKAAAIHKVEADFIANTSQSSRNENVVICHGEQWYDVRALTERELEEFVADLLRAQLDALRSGLLVPH